MCDLAASPKFRSKRVGLCSKWKCQIRGKGAIRVYVRCSNPGRRNGGCRGTYALRAPCEIRGGGFLLSSDILNWQFGCGLVRLPSQKIMRYALAAMGVFALAIGVHKYRNYKRYRLRQKSIPYIELTAGGHIKKLEHFGEYVARQLGFNDPDACPFFIKIAEDYLRGDKINSDQSQENIVTYLSVMHPEEDMVSLHSELTNELDSCMLSYFAFHWDHSSFIINQVLHGNSKSKKKLRAAVLFATRKLRFEQAMKTLRIKNVFSTLVEQMKAMGHHSNDSNEGDVGVATDTNSRSPVLLLIGGGMGAGKSTVLRDILKSSFWSGIAENAVIVEADAFKETDVIYQALSSRGHDDMLESAELVHKSSIDAASSLLVTALNEGRDVIFDGTMSWEPFVLQTIAMARDVHCRRYRMGPGYQIADDCSVHEKYWEPIEDDEPLEWSGMKLKFTKDKGGILSKEASGLTATTNSLVKGRKPYRIELVGVFCDPHLAVVRGMRRAILTRRAVRVKEQLKSHKRFAAALPHYCEVVDHVRLYCTNSVGGPAKLIGWKEGNQKLQVDPEANEALKNMRFINEDARSVYELYNDLEDGNDLSTAWKDIVLFSEREFCQQHLRTEIQKIECYLSKKMMPDLDRISSTSSFSDFSRQSSIDSDHSWRSSISSHSNDDIESDSSSHTVCSTVRDFYTNSITADRPLFTVGCL